MADTKTTALTENTAPLGSDLEFMVDDPAGTPLSQKIYKGTNNLLPEGWMINGKISVTVASNNITLALKTKSGGNPSATDPVSVWINGSFRTCTAALSVTLAAGTNWFGMGPETTGTVSGFFVYLIWNTTPATDIMDIGFAKKPYFRVFSETSATTTNNNYMATGNASTPTATDSCVNIGYFEATLGVTASYNWSVPTFTNTNLIQKPWNETAMFTWTPTITGYSANPTSQVYSYRVVGRFQFLNMVENAAGTSNNTTKTYTIPFVPSIGNCYLSIPAPQNNSAVAAAGIMSMTSTNNTASMFLTGLSVWTNSGTARIIVISGFVPI